MITNHPKQAPANSIGGGTPPTRTTADGTVTTELIGKDGRTYTQFREDVKDLNEISMKSGENFDRTAIALAGGAILVSAANFDKIAGSGGSVILVCVAWAVLAASLLFNLYSHFFFQRHVKALLKNNHDSYFTGEQNHDAEKEVGRIENANLLAPIFCVAGIALVLAAPIVNHYQKGEEADVQTTGSVETTSAATTEEPREVGPDGKHPDQQATETVTAEGTEEVNSKRGKNP